MKIDVKQLIRVLEDLKPAIAKAQMVEQASHYIFSGETIVAFDDRICISHPFSFDTVCSVEGEDLLRSLKTIKEIEAEMWVEKDILIIRSDKVEVELSTVVGDRSAEKMIEGIGIGSLTWSPLHPDFCVGLGICAFTASDDATKRNLTAVHVNQNYMESSDDLRITEYIYDGQMPEVLIPKKAAIEIAKFDAKEYSLTEAWIHFRTDTGLVFSSRIIKESFPDCSSFFEVEGTEIRLPIELKEIAKEVSFMAEGKTEVDVNIVITISKGSCQVEASKSRGRITKDIDMVYKRDKPVKIIINPDFLYEALSRSPVVTISNAGNVALFQSERFRHVIALATADSKEKKDG